MQVLVEGRKTVMRWGGRWNEGEKRRRGLMKRKREKMRLVEREVRRDEGEEIDEERSIKWSIERSIERRKDWWREKLRQKRQIDLHSYIGSYIVPTSRRILRRNQYTFIVIFPVSIPFELIIQNRKSITYEMTQRKETNRHGTCHRLSLIIT